MPPRNELRKAIFFLLKDGEIHNINEVCDKMIKKFKLNQNDFKRHHPKSKRSVLYTNIAWTVSELRKAGILKNIKDQRGVFKITSIGMNAANKNPSKMDESFLNKFSAYREWRKNIKNVKKIKKIEPKKIPKKFGLVAFIDILGTKDAQKNKKLSHTIINWNKLVQNFRKYLKFTIDDAKLTFNTFSDTMIITLEHKNAQYLLTKFGMSSWSCIVESIELNIPIRGCFSIGKFYHKNNLFMGEAIREAAQYYELPQWIGISAAPSAYAKLEFMNESTMSNYYKCSIPLKQSMEQEAWAINWPENYELSRSNEKNNSNKNILDLIDKNLKTITDVNASLKWRNTKKFYHDVLENNANLIP